MNSHPRNRFSPGSALCGARLLSGWLLCALALGIPLPRAARAQNVRTFNQLGGGTFNWNDNANWDGGAFPNGTTFSANMGQNYTGDTTVLINGDKTVYSLIVGHNNTNNTIQTRLFTLNEGSPAGGKIIIDSVGFDASLNKVGNGIANINVPIDIRFFTSSSVAGTLNLNGAVSIGGTLNFTALRKFGGGTLNFNSGLTLAGPGIEIAPEFSIVHQQGVTNIRGPSNTLTNGILIQQSGTAAPGTINFGSGEVSTSTTFSGATGLLRIDAGLVNFGVPNLTTGTVNNNVTIPVDNIIINGGTLNLRNGNTTGTTTLGAGSTNTLTMDGGTINLYTAGGGASGNIVFAPGVRLVMNYTPDPEPSNPQPPPTTFNFTSTSGKDHTLASLTATATSGTVLRSQAGNGILRVGGDGIDDVFNGSLNMSGSGADSRFIKIGTETLTFGGIVNNPTARVQVDQGNLVLAKTSKAGSVGVNAIGATLEVNSGGTVRLGGTFDSFGSTLSANYNDQIFRNAIVTLNGTGTLDLNGFSESFDVLLGDGIVTNTAAATTSILYLGDNNFTIDGTAAARTFDGRFMDGAGSVGLVKSGTQMLTLTNSGHTFTGPTTVTRSVLQLSNGAALTGNSPITLTRNGELILNNTATNNGNRINDSAPVNMERGILTLRGHGTTANITETAGALNINLFSNTVRLNHNSSASNAFVGGTLRWAFSSFNRSPGALVSFTEVTNNAAAGFGANPLLSATQVSFAAMPTAHMVGGNGTGPNFNLLIGAFGGERNNATNHFVTVVNTGGSNFIRPLFDSDYNTGFANTGANTVNQTITTSNLPTAPATALSTFDDVAGILTSLTGVTINVNANTAFNAFRFAVPSSMYIAEDKRFVLGGMAANAGLGTIAFDGSGMALFNAATNIYGGTLFFGAREAILRSTTAAATLTNIQSTIEGTGGLTKGGAGTINLLGENRYSGTTWINEGELGVFTSTALGAMGTANPVQASSGAILRLSGGINFGDGTVAGSKDLFLIGENASLNVDDRHSAWSGSIFLNPTNAAGQSGLNNILRARANGILTVMGAITSIGADPSRGLYDINPSFNGAGQGNNLILENNLSGTSGGIINIVGQISDRNGAAASGNGISSAEHEKLNVIIRGYSGVNAPTISDFVVNIRDATQTNGRLDLRSGFVFIDSDWGTAGKTAFTNGGLIRQHDGNNVDRGGTISGLFLTQPDTTFRGSALQIGESSSSFSSRSMALIGGINRTGTVAFGTDTGAINITAFTGNSNRAYNSSANTPIGSTTITLSTATAINLRPGYGITGPGIAPGTTVTAISGNVITLSNATTADANSGTGYTFGFLPASNILAQGANTAVVLQGATIIPLDSVTGFAVGQGITGPGIPAGTIITAVNTGLNTITINLATTGINNNIGSVYSSFPIGQNTMTLSTTAGLRVGMPVTSPSVPAGTFITAISGNTLTLSAPVTGIINNNANIQFPLGQVNYRSATGNAAGNTTLNFVSTEGLTVGTIVKHAGIPEGTFITDVDHVNNRVTLNQALTGAVNSADVNVQKVSNFNETRLFAAEGGTVLVRAQMTDGGGFSLTNAVAAVSKVGRGTVNLRGSTAGGYSLDGGINIFGGTLIFDYRDIIDGPPPGGDEEAEISRDFSRISQGSANAPHQLTLAGGTLRMLDADSAFITESARGRLFIRPGHSKIEMLAGNGSTLRLNLGYHNPFFEGSQAHYWRAPDRFAGGTLHFEYENQIDDDPDNFGGTAFATYSQNAPSFANEDGILGYEAIMPYTTIGLRDPFVGRVVDFATFVPQTLANGQKDTIIGDASGLISNGDFYDWFASGIGTDVSQWDGVVQFGKGYLSDDYITQDVNTGFTGQLSANFGSDFRGARVVRFASNKTADNILNLGSTRLVLGTASPLDGFLNGGPVQDGGAILISNIVSRVMDSGNPNPVVNHQVITGGSLTSATPSVYFTSNVQMGAYTRDALPAATSTDLIIHNHNELGSFSIQSPLVNFQAGTPMNLVVSGPGLTRLAPSSTSTFTGATYVSGGTLWLAAPSALGQSSSAQIYLNGGTLEWANLTPANRATTAVFPVMSSTRPLVLGGNGGTIKTTAPGTVVTLGGVIRSEENILPLQLAEHRIHENIGVGDLIKTGAGRLIISNGTSVGSTGWNAYYGITEVLQGTLEVRIGNVNSGILGSNYSHLDGTRIAAGARLELQITGGADNGTYEWFDLAGGTLGTTPLHVDGSLDGVIRISTDSTIDVTQGRLRLNPNAGMLEGTGKLTKTGAGTLMLFENNITFSGEIEIRDGVIHAATQGLPFGSGSLITLGDNSTSASGVAGIILQARNAEGLNYKAIYEVQQDILVRAEGGSTQQEKFLGVLNTGTGSVAGGANNDRYVFGGGLTLNDNLILRYTDDAANVALNPNVITNNLRGGGNRIIALTGNLSGSGNLQTEVIQNGGTVNGADNDQLVFFELSGNNTAWTGGIRLGNRGSVDADRQHFLRLMSDNAMDGDNSVTLDFNATLQVGGGARTIGSLIVGDPTGNALANQVIVENAATSSGTLTINQTVDATWHALFRNGSTPSAYFDFDNATASTVLNLIKTGSATATMTQANTYTGFTQIGTPNGPSGGTLRLGTGGSILSSSPLTIYSGTFELSGVNHALNNPLVLGGGASGTRARVRTNTNTLTINNNVVFDATNNPAGASISGNLQMGSVARTFNVGDSTHLGALIDLDVSAVVLGTGGLVKTGPGTMALGGASTYSGGTVVSQGSLLAMNTLGSATGSGAVTVQAGATLGGVGFISGDVTLAGTVSNEAILAPGSPTISSGIELLSLNGSLTLDEFTIVDFVLGQTGWTKLFVNTIVSVHSSTKFRVSLETGYTPTAGATFDLMDWNTFLGGGDTFWLDNLILPVGPSWDASLFTSDGILSVTGTPTAVSIDFHPQNVVTDPGIPVEMSVTPSGTEPWLLQWQKLVGVDTWENVPGATGRIFRIESPQESDEGTYRVIVSNSVNTVISNTAFLEVNDTPTLLAFTRTPPTGNFNPGQSVTFTADATNATTYEWRRGNTVVGTTSHPTNTFTINSLVKADQGLYRVFVSNTAGGILSDPIEVIVNDPPVITAQPQNRLGALGNIVTFSVVATGTPALTYQWQFKPKNGSTFNNLSGQTNPVLQRTVSASTEGTYRVNISNIVTTITSNEATLSMVGGDVNIITQPQHQLLTVGQPLTLTCDATGADPLRFQWRRNGVNIPGATRRVFSVPSATIARGGVYTCVVSNPNNGQGQPSSQISAEARVVVVDASPRRVPVRVNQATTLSINAGGPAIFQWFFDDLEEDEPGEGSEFSPISGANARTLRLTNMQVADRGHYRCRVSMIDANNQILAFMEGGINDVLVYTDKPELLPFDFPNTVVSEPYGDTEEDGFLYFQVPFNQDPTKAPVSLTARGLPPGLRMDNLGRVHGRATASRQPQAYTVTVTARNLVGTDTVTEDLLVFVLNGNLIGVFTGPINPHFELNGDLGGRIDFTTRRTGAVSGSVTLGTTRLPFRTVWNTNVNDLNAASVSVNINRRGRTPLRLELLADAATNRIVSGTLTDTADDNLFTQVGGWRNTFQRGPGNPRPAASVEGYYTFQLELPNALRHTPNTPLLPSNPRFKIPQGLGFGSFNINGVSGRATVTFTTPDGTRGTSATFAGPLYDDDNDTIADKRELLVFRTLYAANARGSALGVLLVKEAPVNSNNTVEGELNWWRPATPAVNHRLYRDGFSAMDLEAEGSRYDGPRKLGQVPPIVMNLPLVFTGANAKISFFNANVEAALPGANFLDVQVNAANRVIPISNNERNIRMTIREANGALSGSFTLREPNPNPPNPLNPANITRNVRFQGLIVRTSLGFRGVGFFNLPQLPSAATEAPNRTPILSGRMVFSE